MNTPRGPGRIIGISSSGVVHYVKVVGILKVIEFGEADLTHRPPTDLMPMPPVRIGASIATALMVLVAVVIIVKVLGAFGGALAGGPPDLYTPTPPDGASSGNR